MNAGNDLLTFRLQVKGSRECAGDGDGTPALVKAEMSPTMAESEEPLRVPPKSDNGKLAIRWLFLVFCALVWVMATVWFFS
jgi:hypothetical protein